MGNTGAGYGLGAYGPLLERLMAVTLSKVPWDQPLPGQLPAKLEAQEPEGLSDAYGQAQQRSFPIEQEPPMEGDDLMRALGARGRGLVW